MLTLLRLANVLLLLSLVGCLAGALAGLVVFVPFVAGAWALNLMALAAYEERGPAPVAEPVPVPGRSRELDEAA